MAVIKFNNGFDRLSDAKLEEKASFIITQMTGNPYFPTPDPLLSELQNVLNAFSNAVADAGNGDRLKVALKNEAKAALVDTLHLLSAYVAYASKGNPVAARSSGFTLAKVPSPAPPLTKPQNLKVVNTDQSGVVKSSVDTVPGAMTYMHQYSTDPELKEESWKGANGSLSKCNLSGLTPGTLYYFRVAAVGRKEQVMYSDVISRVAA